MSENTSQDPILTPRLFTPGPTPIPKNVALAQMDSSVYHRTEDFFKIFRQTAALLSPIMGTKEIPIILTTSGTGAMEAAMQNLTATGDSVLTMVGGEFGERWDKMARAYGCQVKTLKVAHGQAFTLEDLDKALTDNKDIKVVFLQANETSTGVFYPIKDYCAAIRRLAPEALIVVDAISALGAHEIQMDAWGIDCVLGGSQKGFGIPPGLAFVALSKRAWLSLSNRERFYFDLTYEAKEQKTGSTAWTPAISLIYGLNVALKTMHERGLPQIIAQHKRQAMAVRAGVMAMGLELLSKDNASHALTAIKIPRSVGAKRVAGILKDRYQVTYARGQGVLAEDVIRFGHLGFVDRFDILAGLAALEFALHDAGHKLTLGQGLGAAMKILAS